jgi:protein tyrosine/serine phosphatase
MMKDNEYSRVDWLGIVIALVQHMEEGNCCDDINDERLFQGPVNRIIGKIQIVIDENFGGNVKDFKSMLFLQLFKAITEDDHQLLAIENWLDTEWKESAKLYV